MTPPPIRLLVSARTLAEAQAAQAGGADYVDLKEPRAGPLGGLAAAEIATIVAALRARAGRQWISATIGDLPPGDRPAILAQVDAVAATGVDYVKVGIPGIADVPASRRLLEALAACGHAVVPVFLADDGLDRALVDRACGLGFPLVMADTAGKQHGSLFDRVPGPDLADFVGRARGAGIPVGLAGALRLADLPRLAALRPDFAGFRSAVCRDGRGSALDAGLLHGLAQALRSVRPGPRQIPDPVLPA